jgi:DNA polymerase III subunit gamma/tau
MSQALYRKWRPQTWDAVVGQQHVVQTLHNALTAGHIAHAYLFAGPRGTGKTTTARLLAKAVNCLEDDLARRPCGRCTSCQAVNQGRFLDLIEIDAASNTSVDDVRDLREKINFSPNLGRYKVYIIDEVHMLSTAAFNALLKTLEEPPAHAIFVLATTEVHKIPATVLSRCQRHEFRRIPVADIVACLKEIAASEGIQVEPDALSLIARQSTGAMRDAISLLDQLASTGKAITLALVQDTLGTAASQSVLDLVEALIASNPAAGLECIHSSLDAGSDPRQFARQVVDYLRDLLVMRMGDAAQIEATPEMRQLMARHTQSFTPADLLRILRLFNSAAVDTRGSWQPSLPLEMAFVEALEGPSAASEAGPSPATSEPVPSTHASIKPAKPAASAPIEPDQSEHDSVQPGPVEAQSASDDQQLTRNLAASWNKILALVRKENPSAYGLMNSCKSRFMRGDQVLLGFPSELLKDKMEKEVNRELSRRIISEVFQRQITIRCYVDTQQRSAVPPELDDDGIVASAIRDLGGELVDMS